jgi:hypothetical protein
MREINIDGTVYNLESYEDRIKIVKYLEEKMNNLD